MGKKNLNAFSEQTNLLHVKPTRPTVFITNDEINCTCSGITPL